MTTTRVLRPWALALATAASLVLAASVQAQEPKITVMNLDEILQQNPLQTGGPTARVSGSTKAGNSEMQILTMSKIRLHHHEQEDHIVYVLRGTATARLGDQTREVKPGDMLNIPRFARHGFEKKGDQDIVLLVVATAGWKPLEDTKFHD
ncbi:MAG: cupin domain-containing protein [Pseudomonadota bacterium]